MNENKHKTIKLLFWLILFASLVIFAVKLFIPDVQKVIEEDLKAEKSMEMKENIINIDSAYMIIDGDTIKYYIQGKTQ